MAARSNNSRGSYGPRMSHTWVEFVAGGTSRALSIIPQGAEAYGFLRGPSTGTAYTSFTAARDMTIMATFASACLIYPSLAEMVSQQVGLGVVANVGALLAPPSVGAGMSASAFFAVGAINPRNTIAEGTNFVTEVSLNSKGKRRLRSGETVFLSVQPLASAWTSVAAYGRILCAFR